MTFKDQTNNIFALIDTARTLIQNFPMSIFDISKGKNYDSVFEFILDILYSLGITQKEICDELIEKIFDIPESSALYQSVGSVDVETSPFVDSIEDAVKIIIADILTAILSCNINPEIPDYMFSDGISIPSSLLDFQGLLQINPASELGKCYYNTKDYEPTDEEADEFLAPNTMYKSHDLNAFIWYCLNIGTPLSVKEKNKMVWDSRREATYIDASFRDDIDKWNQWLSSLYVNDDINNRILYPIVELSKDFTSGDDKRLRVKISDQKYKGNKFNKSIYKFNNDYLRSIKLFEPKIILTSLLNAILEGGIKILSDLDINIKKTYIDGILSQVIKNIIENDDYSVNDCYYKFDNDDWNKMLDNMEKQKYTSGDLSSEENLEFRENVINGINDSFSSDKQDRSETIKYFINDVSATASTNYELVYGLATNLKIGLSNAWLSELLLQIITPFANALFSPQVMLLFYINFETMGIVSSTEMFDFNKLISFIINKFLSILTSAIINIKDIIVKIIYDFLEEKLLPTIITYFAFLSLESSMAWIELLTEALECLPTFKNDRVSLIDEVNYADIIPTQNVPDNNIGKCTT